MSFDPWNCSLNIQKSTGISTPKLGAPLGVWGFIPSHFPTLSGAWNATPGLFSWLAPLQALVLVASPRQKLRQAWSHSIPSCETQGYKEKICVICYLFHIFKLGDPSLTLRAFMGCYSFWRWRRILTHIG
jgi:hypothetical protein